MSTKYREDLLSTNSQRDSTNSQRDSMNSLSDSLDNLPIDTDSPIDERDKELVEKLFGPIKTEDIRKNSSTVKISILVLLIFLVLNLPIIDSLFSKINKSEYFKLLVKGLVFLVLFLVIKNKINV